MKNIYLINLTIILNYKIFIDRIMFKIIIDLFYFNIKTIFLNLNINL
jgi:hypothetical protein